MDEVAFIRHLRGRMKFQDLFQRQSPVFSLEFFPPKQAALLEGVKEQIRELVQLRPDFVTVTYGAGGGTRAFSQELVRFVHREVKVPVCPHLTCIGHSREELLTLAKEFEAEGIENILALRGDPPKGAERFEPHPEGFVCARDFAAFLKQNTSLGIAVAGYPEGHQEALSQEADLAYLKEKVDAGGELVLTQLFFDEELYAQFVRRARAIGITVPIVPGVMPISNIQQLERFTGMCGASIPDRIREGLRLCEAEGRDLTKWGIEEAIRFGRALLEKGAPGIHLYTLNKSVQAKPILEALLRSR